MGHEKWAVKANEEVKLITSKRRSSVGQLLKTCDE